ncbi:MAG: hypothetical protein P8189_11720 [Anaerolineae bacterium]
MPKVASPSGGETTAGGQEEDPSVTSTPESEDEIPAWLSELGATLTEEDKLADSEPEEDAGEIPDWLRDLRDSLPAEPETEGAEWLTAVPPTPAEGGSEPVLPATGAEEEQIPDWLSELHTEAQAGEPTSPTTAVPGEKEETSGWLDELRSSVTGEESSLTALEAEEEEAPAWLTELQPEAGEVEEEEALAWLTDLQPEASEVEEEEAPAWLGELQPEAEEEEPSPTAGEAEEEEALAWLNELQSEAGEAEEEEAPAWLGELQPKAEEEESSPTAGEAEEEEAPAWLTEFQSEAGEAEDEEAPAWLAELQSEAEEEEPDLTPSAFEPESVSDQVSDLEPSPAEEEPIPAIPEIEAGEIPDWLAELQPPAIEVESEPGSPVLEEATEETTADWLVQLLGSAPEEEPLPEIPAEEARPAEAAPDWVAELRAEAPEETPLTDEEIPEDAEAADWLATPTPSPEGPEALARAEIPAWLMALKPSELREEGEDQDQGPAAEESVEGTGLLAGLRGTLPAEMLIAQPRAAGPTEALGAPPADTPQARLFADIVGRPPVAAPKEIVSPPARALALVPRLIIFVALIAAVSLPLLLQEPLFPRTITAAPATEDMHNALERLDSNASVLVAFDYDPTTSGEMDVLAQALVGHLMDRGVNIVVVSLLPAGPATAQSVLDSLAAERPDYADSYGRRYANLGYLPGQATAVRLMGLSLQTALPRDFQGTQIDELTAMENLDQIQEFDLIVELAATQDTLRWWIEQARMPYDIPLGAGVSASIDPFARPYYETESQQLVGVVSGVPGAAAYEALRSGQDRPGDNLAARLDSQLAGHLIFVLVLLVGNGVYLARRRSGREH